MDNLRNAYKNIADQEKDYSETLDQEFFLLKEPCLNFT